MILDKNSLIIEISPDKKKKDYEETYEKRIDAIVKEYMTLLQEGEEVQLIAPSHEDRKAVNQAVREQLETAHLIRGDAKSCIILSSVDMTEVERSKVDHYKEGHIIRFSINQGRELKAGNYFTILDTDQHNNILILGKEGRKESFIWQVPKKANNIVEVFKKEERDLKEGDKIIWTRTNKKEGILTTDYTQVQKIDNENITVKGVDDKAFTFNITDQKFQHWDHGYAVTTFSSQGGTYSSVLAIFESYRKNLMNLKTFLVTVTRAENHLRIYTDDKEKLLEAILKNKGDKISSLEVIGQYPQNKAKNKLQITTKTLNKALTKSSSGKISFEATSISNQHTFDKLTLEKMKEELNRDAEKIAIHLLGEPKLRGSHFLKFGSKQGSLSVTIKGEKQGWWNDFSESGGRNMLSFIQKYAGFSKREAINFGTNWLGLSHPIKRSKLHPLSKDNRKSDMEDIKNPIKNEKKRIQLAVNIAEQSQPIKGTLAEKYLKEHRGIQLQEFPHDFRYYPSLYSKLNGKTLPALIAIARNSKGKITAVQATYLDEKTANKVDKNSMKIVKQTFGLLKGASVNIEREQGAPTLIAEGSETGLSLAFAINKANIRVILGQANFKEIDPKTVSEKVIFCLDNDGKNIKENKLIVESAKRLVGKNKQVNYMMPLSLAQEKQDYNDILREKGVDPIIKDFVNPLSHEEVFGRDSCQKILNKNLKDISEQSALKVAKNLNSVKPISEDFIQKFTKDLESQASISSKNIQISSINKSLIHEEQKIKQATKIKDFEREI